jgi:hypothetical protein
VGRKPDDPVDVEKHGGAAMGWVRRTDIGPDIWEKPDGNLYRHRNKGEPELAVFMGDIPWPSAKS